MKTLTKPFFAVALLVCLLIAGACAHLAFGAKSLALSEVLSAIFNYNPNTFEHIIVREMRLPRMLTALLVGASLSVAGAMMQGVTRNPLADPGVLALMSGASLGVLLAEALGFSDLVWLPWFAVLGALVAAAMVALVLALAGGGNSPILLLLAGAAVSALLAGVVTGINLLNEDSFANLRLWFAGAITSEAKAVLPYAAPGLVLALVISLASAGQVNAFAMGREVATGLGINVRRVGIKLLLLTAVLTALSVALVGPLGFVGLVVPHAARLIVGGNYRWVLPCSAILGGGFLLWVDLIARAAFAPMEVATGVVTSLLGAPLFVGLVRARL